MQRCMSSFHVNLQHISESTKHENGCKWIIWKCCKLILQRLDTHNCRRKISFRAPCRSDANCTIFCLSHPTRRPWRLWPEASDPEVRVVQVILKKNLPKQSSKRPLTLLRAARSDLKVENSAWVWWWWKRLQIQIISSEVFSKLQLERLENWNCQSSKRCFWGKLRRWWVYWRVFPIFPLWIAVIALLSEFLMMCKLRGLDLSCSN